jgi:hypothetical protein
MIRRKILKTIYSDRLFLSDFDRVKGKIIEVINIVKIVIFSNTDNRTYNVNIRKLK